MAIKRLSAIATAHEYRFEFLLDDSKLVLSQSWRQQAIDAASAGDLDALRALIATPDMVPDAAWVRVCTFARYHGKDQEVDPAKALIEAELAAKDHLARLQPGRPMEL